MPTHPLTPSQHYQAALWLLAVAEGAHEPSGDRAVAATAPSPTHLLAASLPRRARRPEHHHERPAGGAPQQRWLYGDDDQRDKS